MNILVIDDEKSQRDILADILSDAGYQVTCAADGYDGLELIEQGSIDLVLTDLKMPKKDGFDVLKGTRHINPDIQVIIMTAFGTIPSAVDAIKKGAYDYLTKPFKKEELLRVVNRAAEKVELLSENERLKQEVTHRYQYQSLIGSSTVMQQIYGMIDKIKNIDATVMITGASGTGKELVAKAIHYSGLRKDKSFVALNCGAIPETLIESELFGHEKGSFTGAHKTYIGKFEQAQGGTIFLDEIGTMRMDLQIRLLRVLQERKIERIGSGKSVELDVRVIAASNEDLSAKVEANEFRNDLYHRLNVFHIELPLLRERKKDIPLLTKHFIKKFSAQYGKPEPKLNKDAIQKLESFEYPGNVRELEHILEKTIILNDGQFVTAETLIMPREKSGKSSEKTGASLIETEATMIKNALKFNNGSIKKASEKLGVSYKTLQYRLRKFGINKEDYKV